jgi:hypothetical protein
MDLTTYNAFMPMSACAMDCVCIWHLSSLLHSDYWELSSGYNMISKQIRIVTNSSI